MQVLARGAALMAVTLFASALVSISEARSADLSDGGYLPRYGSPYDDPRYADVFRHPAPPPRHEERYEDDDDEAPSYDGPRRRAYRDDDGWRDRRWDQGYLRPMPRGPRFADRERDCIPRRAIRERLKADGWGEFQDLEIRGSTAIVTARRPDGRPFDLTIERCSGEIVSARPLRGGLGPYASGNRRYRAY